MSDTDIHSCGYYCDRHACIEVQRNELRDKLFVKEWVGLTENEKELLWDEAVDGREHFCSQYGDFADAIEAKLKEKNNG